MEETVELWNKSHFKWYEDNKEKISFTVTVFSLLVRYAILWSYERNAVVWELRQCQLGNCVGAAEDELAVGTVGRGRRSKDGDEVVCKKKKSRLRHGSSTQNEYPFLQLPIDWNREAFLTSSLKRYILSGTDITPVVSVLGARPGSPSPLVDVS